MDESAEQASTTKQQGRAGLVGPRRQWRTSVQVLGVLALLAALLFFLWWVDRPTALEAAGEECQVGHLVRDDGASLTLDTKGTDDTSGTPLDKVDCVLTALETPQHVREHMSQTRALDGMQTDEWGDVSARWTYHPNVGMKLTLRTN